jgi:low affinity Fe/Cu permease
MPQDLPMKENRFLRLSSWVSKITGNSVTFIIAFLIILFWAVTGPLFDFSDAWQLTINTGTTIVTFLMVFLIQNTQNRDTAAIQLKLDELIRVSEKAHNALLDIEELSEKELEKIRLTYKEIATAARENLRKGKTDTGVPELHPGVKKKSRIIMRHHAK